MWALSLRCHSRPSPFPRDVGGLASLDGGSGEGGRRGEPMRWETPVVSHETRATTFVVARFRYPSDDTRRQRRQTERMTTQRITSHAASESTPPPAHQQDSE